MNILVVTQYFHPEQFRVNDLVQGLLDRGHAVTVLTGMPNYPEGRIHDGYSWSGPWQEDFSGARVIRVPLLPRGRARNWRLALNYFSFAFFAGICGPLRCRGPYDLIFVYEPSPITVGLPALLLGALKRAPVMLWIQDLWPETLAAMSQRGTALAVGAWLANFVHRRCDVLLMQSQAFGQSLTRQGIAPERLRYLPNWAENLYKSAPATAVPLSNHTGFRVLFAGNLGSAQSMETIVAAAALLRDRTDIHWIIVGDGLMRTSIEEAIRKHGLDSTVFLLGRHPPESMPGYFAGADALLVTLAADPVFALTIPSKIQSYLAAGRPVIGALDGEGARIITESGCGLACAAGDARALAGLVQHMAGMTAAERMAMGERGRVYFETHFERGLLLDRLEGWMGELTERQPCAS